MSQKQTLSLNAVIDLIQTSGQIVPLEQWIPSCNRSQCTTVHHKTQCTTVHRKTREASQCCQRPSLDQVRKLSFLLFVKCPLCLVLGDIQ